MAKRDSSNKKPKISAKWRRLLRMIPGYDPFATAAPGEWFDEEAAQDACDWFSTCIRHVKGPLAGQLIQLEDWQKAVTGCTWGWKQANGLRRYREVFVYVGKKNAKTTWAAGTLLYALVGPGRSQGAEIYSGAASREQAALVFSIAAGMVTQEPSMDELLTIYGMRGGSVTKSITYPGLYASYKCVAADADTFDGANVWLAIADELHRHKNPELANLLQQSTAAQPEALMIYTTTADYNRESVCNTKLKYARAVRDNGGDPEKPGHDSAFLPVIYECSIDDDWTDPKIWRKANPNLDVSISSSFLKRECQKAKDSPTELNTFLRLHMNIVTETDVAWLKMDKWDACDEPRSDLAGRVCFAGLDLASTRDLCAFVMVFPDDETETPSYDVLCNFWIPKETARDREREDHVPYLTWANQGFIELTDGNRANYNVIRRRINELGEKYNIREIAIDRWNSTQLQTDLEDAGFEVVPYGQGYGSMTAPTKEFEALVISRAIRHGANPVLRWMASNVFVKMDDAGNLKPSRKKSSEKIDGIVAAIMGLGRAMVFQDEGPSVYEERGLVTV